MWELSTEPEELFFDGIPLPPLIMINPVWNRVKGNTEHWKIT